MDTVRLRPECVGRSSHRTCDSPLVYANEISIGVGIRLHRWLSAPPARGRRWSVHPKRGYERQILTHETGNSKSVDRRVVSRVGAGAGASWSPHRGCSVSTRIPSDYRLSPFEEGTTSAPS